MNKKFYSQDGQDAFIEKLFKQKRNGIFLDIGAFDGITFSNTYYFEKNLEWTGICVEPNPEPFEKLKMNRKCICENCCIADHNFKARFLSISGWGTMLSGVVDFFDQKHLKRIDQTIEEHGGEKKIVEIEAFPVREILNKHNLAQIDYCNIDVEGGEMNVLQSIDFSLTNIKVFTIENNYNSKEVKNFLYKKGYKLIAKVGADEVYEMKSRRYFFIFNLYKKRLLNFIAYKKNYFKNMIKEI